jgi:hypothetical protein
VKTKSFCGIFAESELAVGFGLVLSGVALNQCVCVKTILPLLFLNMKNILFCNDSLKTRFNLYF